MRQNIPSPLALGRQLAEWRQPLATDPDVEEAVARMLQALERHPQRDPRREDFDFNRAVAG
jgi:hypothetical protein